MLSRTGILSARFNQDYGKFLCYCQWHSQEFSRGAVQLCNCLQAVRRLLDPNILPFHSLLFGVITITVVLTGFCANVLQQDMHKTWGSVDNEPVSPMGVHIKHITAHSGTMAPQCHCVLITLISNPNPSRIVYIFFTSLTCIRCTTIRWIQNFQRSWWKKLIQFGLLERFISMTV